MDKTWIRSLRCLSLMLVALIVFGPLAEAGAAVRANAANVEGRVIVAADGNPVAGVVYRLVNIETLEVVATADTDETGRISIDSLPAGTYHLSVEAPEGYVAAAAPLLELRDGTSANVDVRLLPQEGPDWFDYALKDSVESVDGDILRTDACQMDVVTNAETEWLGDLVSAGAIAQAISGGGNVCMAFEGVNQDDGTFLATAVFAMTCTDDLEAAYDDEAVCPGAVAAGGGATGGLLAGLLGAAAAALGITQLTSGSDGPEVVTQ